MKKAVLLIAIFFALGFVYKAQAQNVVSVSQALAGMSDASQEELKEQLRGQTSFTYITAQGAIDAVETSGKPFDVIEIEDLNGASALNRLTWQLQKCTVLILNVDNTTPTGLNFDLSSLINLKYILIKGYNHDKIDEIALLVSDYINNKNINSTILIEKLNKDR